MKLKRVLSAALSLCVVLSSFNVSFASQQVNRTELLKQKAKDFYSSNLKKVGDVNFRRALQQRYGIEYEEVDNLPNEEKFNEKVRIIVEVDSPSALELIKQKNLPLSNLKLQESKVEDSQKNIINKLKMYGQIRHTYKSVLNGFSMTVNYKDIESIKKIPGVKKVTVANVYYLDMNSAKGLTNTEKVWQELGFKGEGMVVSIVDTGIDYNHKDMKLTDPSKAKLNKNKIEEMGGPGKFYTDKVPYGCNFADLNDEVIDRTDSMHGMHVGGIVAANGDIKGVAPEAQLLAMKVFSNNPELRGAYTDDIAAAIEDSVKHGADVINMSLGSTAGFVMPDDPEQKAIKNATDAGVLVVVSGGNSYYSTYGYYNPYTIDPDMGLVGSPGLFPDTLQVASSENSKITLPALNYRYTLEDKEFSGLMGYTLSEVDPTLLKGEFGLVYCGLGTAQDFNDKDLTGKIALIERGAISFVEKN